jgi:transketolase
MGTMINGMYLFGGVLPICGTFLAFSTYMTPSIRMAALMRIPSIFLFSHDSIFVGEDGPTHHPVEHLTNLRLMPNVNVMRPADPEETKIAWEIALKSKTSPSVIITTRQKVPVIDYSKYESCKNAEHGAYIIKKEKHKNIDLIIMATGSEVYPSLQVAELLEKEGYSVRVVNFFSSMLFERQSEEYKESVLPTSIKKRLMVEAGMSTYWYKYIGSHGDHVSVDRFGISAKAEDLAKVFGINKENIFQKAKDLIKA